MAPFPDAAIDQPNNLPRVVFRVLGRAPAGELAESPAPAFFVVSWAPQHAPGVSGRFRVLPTAMNGIFDCGLDLLPGVSGPVGHRYCPFSLRVGWRVVNGQLLTMLRYTTLDSISTGLFLPNTTTHLTPRPDWPHNPRSPRGAPPWGLRDRRSRSTGGTVTLEPDPGHAGVGTGIAPEPLVRRWKPRI